MRNGTLRCLALFSGVIATGCNSVPPANQPKPDQPEPRSELKSPDTAPTQAEAETTQEPQPAADPSPAEVKRNRPLDDYCARISARAADRCTKQVAELYAMNCRRYSKAKQCEAEITRVLECQVKTPDELLCAHQADPNCADANRQMQACDKGTQPIEQTHPEDLTLPTGWANITDSKLGFTVAMPKGAALDETSAHRTWKAQEGELTYVVASTEAPAGKINSAALLRTITKYVGNRCQLHLKVHGEFELKGVTVVQYESGCTDGKTWRGMMHIWDGNAVSTGFYGPSGSRGVTEPYFYSFAVTH